MSKYGYAIVTKDEHEGFWPSWTGTNPYVSGVTHEFVPAETGDTPVGYIMHPDGFVERGFFFDAHEFDDMTNKITEWNSSEIIKSNGKRFCDENYVYTALKIGKPV